MQHEPAASTQAPLVAQSVSLSHEAYGNSFRALPPSHVGVGVCKRGVCGWDYTCVVGVSTALGCAWLWGVTGASVVKGGGVSSSSSCHVVGAVGLYDGVGCLCNLCWLRLCSVYCMCLCPRLCHLFSLQAAVVRCQGGLVSLTMCVHRVCVR